MNNRHETTLTPQPKRSGYKHFLGASLSIGLGMMLLNSPMVEAAGLLKPSNSTYSELSIKEHHVNVVIEDMYATTTVEQIFHNPNPQDLEAIYSFPVPAKAAVGEFSYWIDGMPVTGEVVEKKQARQIYEQEKQQGRETALVEKDSYKTFDISVFPVKANQDVKIRLVYLQNTQTDTGIGRYVYPLEDGGVDQEALSFWDRNEKVEEQFSFNVKLRTSYPVDGLRMPKHPNASLQQTDAHEWQAKLINSAKQLNSSSSHNAISTNHTSINERALKAAIADDPIDITVTDDAQHNNRVAHNVDPLPLGVREQTSTDNSDSQTHEITSESTSTAPTTVPTTIPTTVTRLDQDILLYWRHAPNLPASVDMIAYKESNDSKGTYKLTLTPGTDLPLLTQGRDWVFILDISGSMQGKFSTLVEGVRQGLSDLSPQDRFKVVLFNDQASNFTKGYLPADQNNVQRIIQKLDQVTPHKGTNLYAGLKNGINQLDTDRSTAVVLVTDGVANVGTTEKSKFLKLLENRDVRLFTFIMGNSANRPLLEGMTELSNGFAMSISNADDISGQLMLAKGKMSHAAMRDVTIEVDGVRSKDLVTPALSNTLYHGQQLTVLGHYYKAGEARVKLTGTINGEKKTYTTRFNLPEQASQHPELERLWAFTAIEELQAQMDYLGSDKDSEQAIVDTAVEYGLMTDYTSMLVVREEVFKALNIQRTNKARTDKENTARELRLNSTIKSQQHRVDQKKPMFVDHSTTQTSSSKPSPTKQGANNSGASQPAQSQQRASVQPSRSGSGGGAVSPWLVIFIAAAIALVQLRRFKK